jgi:hypothetical protein
MDMNTVLTSRVAALVTAFKAFNPHPTTGFHQANLDTQLSYYLAHLSKKSYKSHGEHCTRKTLTKLPPSLLVMLIDR